MNSFYSRHSILIVCYRKILYIPKIGPRSTTVLTCHEYIEKIVWWLSYQPCRKSWKISWSFRSTISSLTASFFHITQGCGRTTASRKITNNTRTGQGTSDSCGYFHFISWFMIDDQIHDCQQTHLASPTGVTVNC